MNQKQQLEEMISRDPDKIMSTLSDLLNGCLSSANQEGAFQVMGISEGKFLVAFDITILLEDGYIGFAGY